MKKTNAHILKFKSFTKAGQSALNDFIESKFDLERIKAFFAGFNGKSSVYSKPGLYKFHSFSEARKYDMDKMLEQACRRNR